MISGVVLIVFGTIGILARRPTRDPTGDEEAVNLRELGTAREEPGPALDPRRRQQEPSASQSVPQPRR